MQSTTVDGHTLKYTVTVGTLPVRDETGKVIAQVMFTAYTMPGRSRPVTFAVNGGPGASSVYLNLGAIGPKKVDFGVEGDPPSEPAVLHDNPGTWLGFTDLVFIDPVGTGFSRALVDDEQATKDFYSTDSDIHYLSRIIYDWLVKNGRMGRASTWWARATVASAAHASPTTCRPSSAWCCRRPTSIRRHPTTRTSRCCRGC